MRNSSRLTWWAGACWIERRGSPIAVGACSRHIDAEVIEAVQVGDASAVGTTASAHHGVWVTGDVAGSYPAREIIAELAHVWMKRQPSVVGTAVEEEVEDMQKLRRGSFSTL